MPKPSSSPDRFIRHDWIDGDIDYGQIVQDLATLNNDPPAGEFPAKDVTADALATLANLDNVVPATRGPEVEAALRRIAGLYVKIGAALVDLGVEVPPHGQ